MTAGDPREAGAMDDLQHIVVKRDGDVTTVTLDRPEKRNALALDVMTELTTAIEAIGTSDARGIILAANGPVFSAGHNFGDMAGASFDEARHVFDVCTRMMGVVQSIPQPVCARVHALAQNFDREHAVHQPAQRGRAPELLVIAAAGVEADHQIRTLHFSGQRL